jgi:hypothetical protein
LERIAGALKQQFSGVAPKKQHMKYFVLELCGRAHRGSPS